MADQHTCPHTTKEEVCTQDSMGLTPQDNQAPRSQGCLMLHQNCQKEMHLCSTEALSRLAKFCSRVVRKCIMSN